MKLLCLILLVLMPVGEAKPLPPQVKTVHPAFERHAIVLPPTTPEQEIMLSQLGDESFSKREQAFKYFQENTRDCLSILKKGVSNKDAQISDYCKIVLHKYIQVDIKPLSIWCLSNDLRFKDEDVALKYFKEAFPLVHPDAGGEMLYWDWDVSILATKIYVIDLMLEGATWHNIDNIMTEMIYNQNNMKHQDPGTEEAFLFGFPCDIPKNVIPSALIKK